MGAMDRLKHAWNAFVNEDNSQRNPYSQSYGPAYSTRPDRLRTFVAGERSILASIQTRIGIDVAAVPFYHVRVDADGRYVEDIDSKLNSCFTLEANIDQGASAFRQDTAMTLIDKGTIAITPIDTTINPAVSSGYDIQTMRVGEIVEWYPADVKVNVYNDRTGRREEVIFSKRIVAVVENPLYSVMNEINSTWQRLVHKLALLDIVDEASSSGKLDLIIQLPYVIKTDTRKQQAEQRRSDIELQLKGSKYGIAYTDGTEKITQLNRPAENNLMTQVEYLTKQLYSQLGLTEAVMDGTADEAAMLNYMSRTIDPILRAIAEAMKRTFLTKTGRAQGQSIMYFRDPFKLVPLSVLAEITDKLTRAEVVSANEIRSGIGYKPSKDPKADQLRNANMPAPSEQGSPPPEVQKGDSQNGS